MKRTSFPPRSKAWTAATLGRAPLANENGPIDRALLFWPAKRSLHGVSPLCRGSCSGRIITNLPKGNHVLPRQDVDCCEAKDLTRQVTASPIPMRCSTQCVPRKGGRKAKRHSGPLVERPASGSSHTRHHGRTFWFLQHPFPPQQIPSRGIPFVGALWEIDVGITGHCPGRSSKPSRGCRVQHRDGTNKRYLVRREGERIVRQVLDLTSARHLRHLIEDLVRGRVEMVG